LHYHDLRREFGSRVLESGSSLVEARDLLGHSNIAQTSTYLQSTVKSLGFAIERKEAYEQRLAEARRQHEADEKQQQEEAAHAAEAPVPEGVVLSPAPDRVQ
jgi:integrase